MPFDTNNFRDEFIALYNNRCSPKLFTKKREASQKYIFSIPDVSGALILNSMGDISLNIQEKLSAIRPLKSKPTSLTRESLLMSRVGQGRFREEVLALWKNTCPITDVNRPELLIASHIVSWQLSNDEEKLDKFNGLPLSPNVDKLFDKGFISFSDEGRILVHERIPLAVICQLGIDPNKKIEGLQKKHTEYLKRHRIIHEIIDQHEIVVGE